MVDCLIALGSNLNNRQAYLSDAKMHLASLSKSPLLASSLYETEPVGGVSTYPFLNSIVQIQTDLQPSDLLKNLKDFEIRCGRDPNAKRWSNRVIDLDIITYGEQRLQNQILTIPHPEYTKRLFVLLPLKEIHPDWKDPIEGKYIDEIILSAPQISVSKTNLNW